MAVSSACSRDTVGLEMHNDASGLLELPLDAPVGQSLATYLGLPDASIELIKNPDLRRAMGKEGRRRVEQDFNWEKESRKLLALYDELLAA